MQAKAPPLPSRLGRGAFKRGKEVGRQKGGGRGEGKGEERRGRAGEPAGGRGQGSES